MPMVAELWTISGLATELGVEQRTISTALATVPPDGETTYKNRTSKAWYMRTAVNALDARAGSDTLNIKEEQARKAKEEADRLAMLNQQARRELLPAAEVNSAMQSANARTRARLLAIPNKLAPVVLGMESLNEIQEKLMAGVREALEELSETQVAGVPAPEGGKSGDA